MSKKQATRRTVRIGAGDLDVGGILKNGKAGQELRKAVVLKLKKFIVEDKPKKLTMYDILLKSDAIVEVDEPVDHVKTEPTTEQPAN